MPAPFVSGKWAPEQISYGIQGGVQDDLFGPGDGPGRAGNEQPFHRAGEVVEEPVGVFGLSVLRAGILPRFGQYSRRGG
jgi:hypothetical protein